MPAEEAVTRGKAGHVDVASHLTSSSGSGPPTHGTMPVKEAVSRSKAGHVALMHDVDSHHSSHPEGALRSLDAAGVPPASAAHAHAVASAHAPLARARALGGSPGDDSPKQTAT